MPRLPLREFDISALGIVEFEFQSRAGAEVVVVVPLHNYGSVIAECLTSVIDQDLPDLSLVVVDDASTDDGLKVATRLLKRECTRFSSVKVIRHLRNQGVAMARNSGIVRSVEGKVFLLDADNRLRRPALSRLLAALDCSGADFAYSQLEMFGDSRGVGCADVWLPSRLAHENYIDAMTLIRRETLIAAGGFVDSAVETGWEDYDLWCRCAALGFRGIFLPEVLCEYRVSAGAMLRSRTNLKERALRAELALRYPSLLHADRNPTRTEG